MKLFFFLLGLALLVLGVMIIGGELCLSDGCCYKTSAEIQQAKHTLLWTNRLWFGLLGLALFLLFRRIWFFFRKKNIRVKIRAF